MTRTFVFQWEFGSATDDEYKPLSWPLVQARIQSRIDRIMESTGADKYQLYLTSDDKSNFRYELATIKPYKGNRLTEKPHWYTHIRNFLVDFRGAIEVFGQEADDTLGIEQYSDYKESKKQFKKDIEWFLSQNKVMSTSPRSYCDTIICSRDKDLHMIPGWHYTWGAGKQKEKELWFQDEVGGLRCFYSQLLTGDSVDNIPGLYGVGKSSTHIKYINSLNIELDMYEYVRGQYELRFGSYAEQFLIENARLLWIRREEGELWEPLTLNKS